MSLVVARLLAPKAFGSFALATAAWITLLGLNRAVLINPYVVAGSSESSEIFRRQTRQAAGGVLLFGVAGSIAFGVTGALAGSTSPTGQCFLVLSVLSPFLLVQDFWRFAAFCRNSARTAVVNDGAWAVVQGLSLLVVVHGHRSPAAALAAWGAGAIAGAWLGLWQFRMRPEVTKQTLRWLRDTSKHGGWFGLSNGVYAGSNQLVAVIVAAGGGPAALGGLRAVQTLLGPAQLVAQSGDAVALPAGSRTYVAHGGRQLTRFAWRYGLLLTLILGCYSAVLVIGGRALLRLVLGSTFLPYANLVLPLGLGLVATAWSVTSSVALRSALAGRFLAQAEGAGALARVACVTILLYAGGIVGAAWGVFIGSICHAAIMWTTYLKTVARTSRPTRQPKSTPALEPLAP